MPETEDILFALLKEVEGMSARVAELTALETMEEENRRDVMQISYPNDGSHATLGIGVTDIDFEAGTIIVSTGAVSQMSTSLKKRGKEFMQSVTLKTDVDVVIQFDNEDKIAVDAHERYQASGQEYKRLRITCTAATEFAGIFSSAR